jgi:hypothetical protein
MKRRAAARFPAMKTFCKMAAGHGLRHERNFSRTS